MKSLVDYLKECVGTAPATPANTMGMGSCTAPTDTTYGSGDIPNAQAKPYRKYKKKKNPRT